MTHGIKKAVIAALCWLCVIAMIAFSGAGYAWAGDLPALGSMVSPLGEQDPWKVSLEGAEGSQLGLYYYHANSTFMQLKFSPSSVTVYSTGVLNRTGSVSSKSGVYITVKNSKGESTSWIDVPSKQHKPDNILSIPISDGEVMTLRYPTFDILHSYAQNSPLFSCDPNTFNSDITHTLISWDGGKVIKSESGINQNYFVSRDGGIHEISYQDEAVKFANGSQIDFDPADDTFAIQSGSESASTSVKVTSAATGKVIETLSLNQSAQDLPFDTASRVEISTTSSNPITSVENTFSGKAIPTSELDTEGWDLSGDNVVINRYNAVKLYWEPTAQNLPVYRYMLYKYLGNADFTDFRDSHPAFFNWLINDPEALNLFLTSGYASTSLIGGMGAYLWDNSLQPSSELSSLNVWSHIWGKYPNSHGGEDLKIAVAVALDFAHGVMAWQPGTPIDPMGRYEIYANAFADHTLIGTFGDYSAQMLRDVVDDRISNAGMKWLRSYILGHNPLYTVNSDLSHGYWLISYLEYSPYGSAFHGGFYGPRSTIWNMMRYGGVCGAMSKTSQFLLNAFGMPGRAVGQPHHCAYMFFYTNGKWELGYNYAGWSMTGSYNHKTGEHFVIPWIFNGTQLNTDQFAKNKSYLATFQAELDEAEDNWTGALSSIKQAVNLAPNNVAAWTTYIGISNHMDLGSGLKEQIQNNFEAQAKDAVQAFGGGFTYEIIISTLTSEVKS